ncbi:MAG: NUDIX hydrolase [Roseibium sp.]
MQRSYPSTPLVGVSVLCYDETRVLLIKRGKNPYKDHWSLPGGLVELGETLIAAAKRELWEETGVTADLNGPIETFDSIQHDDHGRVISHFILVMFQGPLIEGQAIAGDDAAALDWVTPDQLDDRLTTPGTPERIRKHLEV